ncbi:unnamed protein product [Dovyalis caffra]|uniref:Uncharacterized protein n=1 Tax=Dovyalis caffra TaxID=77055 RepID=A0AAV1QS97_9ROSI|nr:unnamed protein product [Dovyalis caffra]
MTRDGQATSKSERQRVRRMGKSGEKTTPGGRKTQRRIRSSCSAQDKKRLGHDRGAEPVKPNPMWTSESRETREGEPSQGRDNRRQNNRIHTRGIYKLGRSEYTKPTRHIKPTKAGTPIAQNGKTNEQVSHQQRQAQPTPIITEQRPGIKHKGTSEEAARRKTKKRLGHNRGARPVKPNPMWTNSYGNKRRRTNRASQGRDNRRRNTESIPWNLLARQK